MMKEMKESMKKKEKEMMTMMKEMKESMKKKEKEMMTMMIHLPHPPLPPSLLLQGHSNMSWHSDAGGGMCPLGWGPEVCSKQHTAAAAG